MVASPEHPAVRCSPIQVRSPNIREHIVSYNVGSVARFSCIKGILEGPRELTCLRNGSWSDHSPVCISKYDLDEYIPVR